MEKRSKVLLFSGGVDSLASYCILRGKVDTLLYIRTGVKYQEREYKAIMSLLDMLGEEAKARFRFIDMEWLKFFEKENWEIPYRNLLFVVVAKYFGDIVVISIEQGTENNESRDRSPVFFSKVNDLFSYMDDDSPVTIENPVAELTKADEILEIANHVPNVGNILRATYSCYRGMEKECGVCPACIRKYLALKYWEKELWLDHVEDWFLIPPTESRLLYEYFKRAENGYYTGKRAEQYLAVKARLIVEGVINE